MTKTILITGAGSVAGLGYANRRCSSEAMLKDAQAAAWNVEI